MSEQETQATSANDVRPIIATGSQSNWGVWVFCAVLLLGGFMLYNALSAAEDAETAPSVLAPSDTPGSRIASPPPLQNAGTICWSRTAP